MCGPKRKPHTTSPIQADKGSPTQYTNSLAKTPEEALSRDPPCEHTTEILGCGTAGSVRVRDCGPCSAPTAPPAHLPYGYVAHCQQITRIRTLHKYTQCYKSTTIHSSSMGPPSLSPLCPLSPRCPLYTPTSSRSFSQLSPWLVGSSDHRSHPNGVPRQQPPSKKENI